MNRSTFLASSVGLAVAIALPRIARAQSADIVLKTPTGDLHGTLLVPSSLAAPMPVVMLHPGSGPTDRDGNALSLGVRLDTLKLLADALAARGIASLRYDKRGIAQSAAAAPAEADMRFDTYADDAVLWLAVLRADMRFSRVIFAGHSEGALIGMVAAQRGVFEGFASLEGMGRTLVATLREQLKSLPPTLHAQAFAIMDGLDARKTTADVPPELKGLLRPSVQPYLISENRYDPAVEIARLTIPTLITQGTADIQVTVADGARLHKAAPKAVYILVDGMNHVLKIAPDVSTPAAIQTGYVDPALPIAAQVIDGLVTLAGAR